MSDSTKPDGDRTETFRRLLGCFATGVTVVTSSDDRGRAIGMTASAVSAVSLDPPLLLVCVNKRARMHEALSGCTGFVLNVLAGDQGSLAELFAGSADDPFADIDHSDGPDGIVMLDGVAAHIVCGPWGTYDAGDHTVFFGEVRGGHAFGRLPLVHYRSHYTTTADQVS